MLLEVLRTGRAICAIVEITGVDSQPLPSLNWLPTAYRDSAITVNYFRSQYFSSEAIKTYIAINQNDQKKLATNF